MGLRIRAPPTPVRSLTQGSPPRTWSHPEFWLSAARTSEARIQTGVPLAGSRSPPAQQELVPGRFSSHWLQPVVCHSAQLGVAQRCLEFSHLRGKGRPCPAPRRAPGEQGCGRVPWAAAGHGQLESTLCRGLRLGS